MEPPLVLRIAMIMPTSNPLALAWEPATSNIPNAAWVFVMLHAPVRPFTGVGPGVAAATPAPAPLAASARAAASTVVRALIGRSFPAEGLRTSARRSRDCYLPTRSAALNVTRAEVRDRPTSAVHSSLVLRRRLLPQPRGFEGVG